MKKTAKFMSVLLALCVMLSSTCIIAFADVAEPVYNETYNAYYSTLDEALAESEEGDVIFVMGDCDMSSSAIIPAGVTVTVASNSALNDSLNGNNVRGNVSTGNAYATLSIPTGVTLTVNGTLLVAGNQQSTQPKSGCLTGDYGAITLDGNIIVNGKLYARGMITGEGNVIANSGSSVYQLFQIDDWRGGTGSFFSNYYSVFPFNLYEIKNIQTDVAYMYGSELIGQTYIYAGGSGYAPEVCIIGANGLLHLNSGYITTSYSSNTLTAIINGAVQTGDISLSISGTTYSSSGLILPFGYNMDVEISANSTLTINNKIKLLPGCDIVNNGSMVIPSNGALYVYNAVDYLPSYNFAGWGGTANATVTGTGNVTHAGSYAQSNSSGSLSVPEFKQSGYTRVYVPFAAVS